MTSINNCNMKTVLDYVQNPNFPNRYISPDHLIGFIQTNLSDYATKIGESTFGDAIYVVTIGNGPINVLAWSQMHGNESNATHAFFDLLQSWSKEQSEEILNAITLDFIVMLNPDGSRLWKRRNGHNIDLNRDYNKRSSKELNIFLDFAFKKKYDYALNMHEQRTIFSTDGIHPATFSFLSPSEGVDREITENRKKSMAVINKVRLVLEDHIPNHLARYTDEFYPNSIGDNFMKAGIPNILFEGGHYEDDYKRTETRKYYTIALYESLKAIAELKNSTEGWEGYLELPENKETHYDVIYRNVKMDKNAERLVDIAIQYREVKRENESEIDFVSYVAEIGDLTRKKGWKEVEASEKTFICEDGCPNFEGIQNFEII